MRIPKHKQTLTKHFEYKTSDVEELQFQDFFVRGESRKGDQKRNVKLIVFFLHDGKLFQWIKGF
jgi:hypothetical protein